MPIYPYFCICKKKMNLIMQQGGCLNVMKRLACLFALFLSFVFACVAQEKALVSCVVDADTGEPVPFATVRVQGGAATIANAEGCFELEAPSGAEVRVSSVGYRPYVGKAGSLGGEVRLRPAGVVLGEVTVVPWGRRIGEIARRASKSAFSHRNAKANYLYRQTTEVGGATTSMVEAFFEARSAFSLRRLRLLAGRYSSIDRDGAGNYSHLANLYPLSQVEVVNMVDYIPFNELMPPLSAHWDVHFATDCSVVDDGGRMLYSIRFTPKLRAGRKMFNGTLFVDASTLLPVKMEGRVENVYIITNSQSDSAGATPADERVTVVYDTAKGYSEVQSVYVSVGYRNGNDSVRFRSLMYCVGDLDVGKKSKARPAVDLRRQIDRLGYDAAFWADKEIVMRTGAEAAMARLFDGGDGNPDGNSDVGKAVVSVGKGSAALDSLRRFVGNIDAFNRLFPQEKVYLHFDNTGYFRDETMWFSAYVVRADRRALTDMSRVLYVELLDPTGEVVQTRKVRLEGGRGSGSFKLDKLLASGFYEVRAYTRYMLNWDAAWAFSRVFPVFDAPKREGDYSRPAIAEPVWRKRLPSSREADTLSAGPINVAFYPEGGRLVQGLPSRVAFAVTDGEGRPMDCTGRLTLADGTGADVKTLREGRGAFAYTPTATPAKLTIADGRGRERTFSLPAADASGCVMSVDAVTGDYIDVDIRRTADFREPLALVLLSGGNVDATDIIGGDEQEARRRFARADMADGVSQLAVIDGHGRIVAERMVFVHPHGGIDTIRISAAGSLSPCGKVRLEARARPGATFSLSVRDAATDANGVQGEAATWLLLSS